MATSLLITTHEDPWAVTIKVEGKLCGAYVSELQNAWRSARRALISRALTVDLRGLTHVDKPGMQLLRHIYAESGADFVVFSPLTRYFAEQARVPANGSIN